MGPHTAKINLVIFRLLTCCRSALKKVMERDDAASRTMVLCVSSVSLSNDKLTENHVPEENTNQGDNGDKKLAKKNPEVSFHIHSNYQC